uniref:Uncharacterized protein n=1 Tax=Arundo donax TaxID=35708 RepID=A0A0A8YS80_ARUDO
MGMKSWSATSSVTPASAARSRLMSPRLPTKNLYPGPRTPCARRRRVMAWGRHTRYTSALNTHDASTAATAAATIQARPMSISAGSGEVSSSSRHDREGNCLLDCWIANCLVRLRL